MDLSIIIVNWNTSDLLKRCLESIIEFTYDIRFELIVIDNGSSDGSKEMVESSFPSVNLIKNKINRGFSKGVNQGIKAANGGNLLLLNSDTYINENTFAGMVGLMGKKKHIGAMTCRVLYPDGRSQSAYCSFPSLSGMIYGLISIAKLFNHSKLFYKYDVSQWDYSVSKELTDGLWPGGGCLMIKQEVIQNVGIMDENFGYAYLEDADLCYRIKNAGYSFYFLAEATVYHHHSYSVSNCDQKFKDILTLNLQQNKFYFFKKHYGNQQLFFLKAVEMSKNLLIEFYWLFAYICTLRNKKKIREKIKLYAKLLAGSFIENKIKC